MHNSFLQIISKDENKRRAICYARVQVVKQVKARTLNARYLGNLFINQGSNHGLGLLKPDQLCFLLFM